VIQKQQIPRNPFLCSDSLYLVFYSQLVDTSPRSIQLRKPRHPINRTCTRMWPRPILIPRRWHRRWCLLLRPQRCRRRSLFVAQFVPPFGRHLARVGRPALAALAVQVRARLAAGHEGLADGRVVACVALPRGHCCPGHHASSCSGTHARGFIVRVRGRVCVHLGDSGRIARVVVRGDDTRAAEG
jgi:hypothetical protein